MMEADADERERWLAGAAALAAEVLTRGRCPGRRRRRARAASERPGYAWQHGLYWLASNISPTRRWCSRR